MSNQIQCYILRIFFIGKGAYQSWFYEISLFEDDGTENEILEKVTGAFLEVENLVPNTTYQVKVRAWSKTGSGPWSEVFVGRTLSLGKYFYIRPLIRNDMDVNENKH